MSSCLGSSFAGGCDQHRVMECIVFLVSADLAVIYLRLGQERGTVNNLGR